MTLHDAGILLLNSKPVIALVDPSLLYNRPVGFGHFVVLLSIELGEVQYHDPDVGPNMTSTIDRFELAWQRKNQKAVVVYPS
jgi:hypothetical protein